MTTGGALVLVVGPSGAGKDTLIGRARETLANDPRFSFPRRIITREATPDLEDHDTIAKAEFDRHKLRGDYALDWEAHGLSYALPCSVDSAIHAGRIQDQQAGRLLRFYEEAIQGYTYLEDPSAE